MDGITTAMSTFSAVGFAVLRWWDCVCVCVSGMNLKYALQFILYYASAVHKHTHTYTLKPFQDSEPTGLKVNIAITT